PSASPGRRPGARNSTPLGDESQASLHRPVPVANERPPVRQRPAVVRQPVVPARQVFHPVGEPGEAVAPPAAAIQRRAWSALRAPVLDVRLYRPLVRPVVVPLAIRRDVRPAAPALPLLA